MDTIVERDAYGDLHRIAFPVEIEARTTIEVSPGESVEYVAHIDLDNPIRGYEGNGPHGPHVGYDFDRVGGIGPRGHAGHVFLNVNIHLPDRHRGMTIEEFRELMQDYIVPIRVMDPTIIFDGSLDGEDFLLVRIGVSDDIYNEDLNARVNFYYIEIEFHDNINKFPKSKIFKRK